MWHDRFAGGEHTARLLANWPKPVASVSTAAEQSDEDGWGANEEDIE
jgi:hypothetical protein